MKFFLVLILLFTGTVSVVKGQSVKINTSDTGYLSSMVALFKTEWPKNRTINIAFHGHSVPAGYFKTPDVKTMDSYPELTLKYVSSLYPTAVINAIRTCIGGETSAEGAARFDSTVLNHHPDILFIDYALNDRGIGLEEAKKAWTSMIKKALAKNIKVILLTPTPDQSVNILDTTTVLYKHTQQVIQLSNEYKIGLVDSYNAFRKLIMKGNDLKRYMSQGNHPNKEGHEVVLKEIMKLFSKA